MKKWVNTELDNGFMADKFREYLKANYIQYESSGCYNLTHFECKMDASEMEAANNYIDEIWAEYQKTAQ